tara:strand:+ start:79 stop:231 length:153 start_codon:yes stop_codon:yes gene_type:complete
MTIPLSHDNYKNFTWHSMKLDEVLDEEDLSLDLSEIIDKPNKKLVDLRFQ